MSEREKDYWWHLGRIKIIDTYLNRFIFKNEKNKILNVGCGTGGTIKMLEKYGDVDNVDISEDAIKFMKKEGYTKIKKVEGTKLPYKDKSFDLVIALDVLEHIEYDKEALKEWERVLKPGGKVLLTVPAYQRLWSEHDISLYHFRRYRKGELHRKGTETRLNPVKISYAIVFSLPLVAGFRLLNKVLGRKVDSETSYVNLPKALNSIFTYLLSVEAFFHKYINFWFGTSLIAVYQKNND
jgi:ubiquinone/menaquinone biosynthesis C-methylase UbiE